MLPSHDRAAKHPTHHRQALDTDIPHIWVSQHLNNRKYRFQSQQYDQHSIPLDLAVQVGRNTLKNLVIRQIDGMISLECLSINGYLFFHSLLKYELLIIPPNRPRD